MMSSRSLIFAAALLMLVVATGCKSNNEEAAAPAVVPQPPVVGSSSAPAVPGSIAIQGKVLETIDAATYSYVNVDTGSGEQWVAVPAAEFEVGQEVSFASGMEMKDLESKTLGRTFDSVIFSSGPSSAGGSAPAAAGATFNDAMMQEAQNAGPGSGMAGNVASSGGSQAAMVESAEVQVEKADGENAYTVGEVFAQRNDLNNQKVRIRGKVVKVSMMIMGKNWIHLQDGTGDAAGKTHDLVVTTTAEPEKDSVVVIEGTLMADKDFGSGYRYDVIIEDADIQ